MSRNSSGRFILKKGRGRPKAARVKGRGAILLPGGEGKRGLAELMNLSQSVEMVRYSREKGDSQIQTPNRKSRFYGAKKKRKETKLLFRKKKASLRAVSFGGESR